MEGREITMTEEENNKFVRDYENASNLLTPENMLRYIAHQNVRDNEILELNRDKETRIIVAKEKLNKLYDLFKVAEIKSPTGITGEYDFKKWSHNDRIEASCLVDEAWMEITLYLFEKDEAEANNDYSTMEELK